MRSTPVEKGSFSPACTSAEREGKKMSQQEEIHPTGLYKYIYGCKYSYIINTAPPADHTCKLFFYNLQSLLKYLPVFGGICV